MIKLVEVGPRDGLQNEKAIIPTDIKVAFVNALSETGLQEIEVSSFVSPRWIPQLSDAEAVFSAITRKDSVIYSALVPNEKGMDRALAAGVDKMAVFTAASEEFTRKNINATIAESLERFEPVVKRSPVPVRGYVSTAFHCPYEGKISVDAVVDVSLALLDMGCSEVSIGDTIGKAVPDEVTELLSEMLPVIPAGKIAMHFHDTFGQAVTNAKAAADLGITTFDSSAGGLGGCPFAEGAPGNVSTEALARTFETGVDLDKLKAAERLIAAHAGRSVSE